MTELSKKDKQDIADIINRKLKSPLKRGTFEISFSPEGTPGAVKITIVR